MKRLLEHRYGILLFSFIAAAALTGIGCVWFMWGFEGVLARRLDFASIGRLPGIVPPVVFLLSVELIRRFAPCAAGPGIPQAIFAAQNSTADNEERLKPLTSMTTMA